jgi:hypothetical protein
MAVHIRVLVGRDDRLRYPVVAGCVPAGRLTGPRQIRSPGAVADAQRVHDGVNGPVVISQPVSARSGPFRDGRLTGAGPVSGLPGTPSSGPATASGRRLSSGDYCGGVFTETWHINPGAALREGCVR